nr:vegetative cell wall protein gp1-like [Aegilops tauschii subsp. strangulata]
MGGSRDGDGDLPPPAVLAPSDAPAGPLTSPASAPPSPLSAPTATAAPLPPSPAPTPALRVRWADLADEEPFPSPAGLPSPPPVAPRRTAQLGRAGGSAPQARGSAAGSRQVRSTTPPSSLTQAAGTQGGSLRCGEARRRRVRSWGVAGRSDRGSTRLSWRRPLAARPVTAPASSATRPGLAPMAPVVRFSPFRPFIATFGSSSLRLRVSIPLRRPALPLAGGVLVAPAAEAPPARSGENLQLVPPRRPLGLASAARGILGRGPAHQSLALAGPASPRLGRPGALGPCRRLARFGSLGDAQSPHLSPRLHTRLSPPTARPTPSTPLPAVPCRALAPSSPSSAAVCHTRVERWRTSAEAALGGYRREPSRPSPDALRHEEELRHELRELRDGRRDDRRSPARRDTRGRSRSPHPAVLGDWRPRRRSPSPVPSARPKPVPVSLGAPLVGSPPCSAIRPCSVEVRPAPRRHAFGAGFRGHPGRRPVPRSPRFGQEEEALRAGVGRPSSASPGGPGYGLQPPSPPVLQLRGGGSLAKLMMYGHGIEGLGFFHLKWDWVVTPTAGHIFTVVFPDSVSHGYATRSGPITLALNQLVVDITEPVLDAPAVAVLDTAWILVGGLPDIARSKLVIRQMSRILGKVVMVDELSLWKEEEVRVKVK